MQDPNWTATGVVVDIRGDKALFMIPDIGMMTQIKFKNLPQLDEQTNCVLFNTPYLLKTHSKNYVLIHGDELCTDDKQYQRLKHGRQNITLH
jgi:predicted AAA+ superfamily ATPase